MRIPKEGEMIELHLVTRQKNSAILLDESTRKKGSKQPEPHLYVPGTVPFSRVVLTYDISPIVESERKQLTDALWLANSSQELELVPFLEEGLAELEAHHETFNKLFGGMVPESLPKLLPSEVDPSEYTCTYQVSWGDNIFLLP